MPLPDREKYILWVLYVSREKTCMVSYENILSHYAKHYDDDECKESLNSLIQKQMIETKSECFYRITVKGIQYSLGG